MRTCKMQQYLGAVSLTTLMVMASCGGAGNDDNVDSKHCSAMVGDLVITEIMANPFGADNGQEWFEVYNASSKEQVLNYLILKQDYLYKSEIKTKEHVVKTTQTIQPGQYFVFGDGEHEWVDYNYASGLNDWPNSYASLSLLCNDDVIDSITYSDDEDADCLSKPVDGAAYSLDGSVAPDAMANDVYTSWCLATAPYDEFDNWGTPGQPNPPCGVEYCDYQGSKVEVLGPSVGDLIITEIYANPKGTDGKKEYFELYNTTDHNVDLYGMKLLAYADGATEAKEFPIMATGETTKTRKDCVTMAPGYILVGQSINSEENGGILPYALFSGSIPNAKSSIRYELVSGYRVIDSTPNFGKSEDGQVIALHPADYASHEDLGNYCSLNYDEANDKITGTPGAPNTECVRGFEQPDDPVIVVPENCTGNAPVAGDLVISEIYANAPGAAAAEFDREYIEVYATKDVTFSALTIVSKSKSSSRKFTVSTGDCITLKGNQYYVFGGNIAASQEHGITVNYAYTGSKDGLFQPTADYTIEILYQDTLIDSAPNSLGNKDEAHSANLDPSKLTAIDNDDIANWCLADFSAGKARGECVSSDNPGDNTDVPGDNTDTPSTCNEVAPAAGDLIITELFTNPLDGESNKYSAERALEWVEIYAVKDLTITNLTLQTTASKTFSLPVTIPEKCYSIQAGQHLVLSFNADKATNGNIDVDLVYTGVTSSLSSGLHQPNNNYKIGIAYNNVVIDEVPNFKVNEGQYANLDRDHYNSTENDDIANWCAVDTPTPGAQNTSCN